MPVNVKSAPVRKAIMARPASRMLSTALVRMERSMAPPQCRARPAWPPSGSVARVAPGAAGASRPPPLPRPPPSNTLRHHYRLLPLVAPFSLFRLYLGSSLDWHCNAGPAGVQRQLFRGQALVEESEEASAFCRRCFNPVKEENGCEFALWQP
jgi:hypothetical protein